MKVNRRQTKSRLYLSAHRKKRRGENLERWREKQRQKEREEVSHAVKTEKNECLIYGRRIVDFDYFVKSLQSIDHHGDFGCTFSAMKITSEQRNGLNSLIHFKCNTCNVEKTVSTTYIPDAPSILPPDVQEPRRRDINTDAVCGILNTGCIFSDMNEFFSVLEIPVMSLEIFCKERKSLSKAWRKAAAAETSAASSEVNRDVDASGPRILTVVGDGSWAERSYSDTSSRGVEELDSTGENLAESPFTEGEKRKRCTEMSEFQSHLQTEHTQEDSSKRRKEAETSVSPESQQYDPEIAQNIKQEIEILEVRGSCEDEITTEQTSDNQMSESQERQEFVAPSETATREIERTEQLVEHRAESTTDHIQGTEMAHFQRNALNVSENLLEVDEFSAYGVTVAAKLRKMHPEQRLLAENVMNQALFMGLRGQLDMTSKVVSYNSSLPCFPRGIPYPPVNACQNMHAPQYYSVGNMQPPFTQISDRIPINNRYVSWQLK